MFNEYIHTHGEEKVLLQLTEMQHALSESKKFYFLGSVKFEENENMFFIESEKVKMSENIFIKSSPHTFLKK